MGFFLIKKGKNGTDPICPKGKNGTDPICPKGKNGTDPKLPFFKFMF
mgnify:CR=1 FL=1